ncbi:MAG: hypothetical protein C4538_10845 [Nitrospiraceae bacterium]|nr:MAG: hypothetical protein C4538_10845 [Nitrospiraceae bacterium]
MEYELTDMLILLLHMKKIILLPVFLLLLPSVSGAEEVILKLRTSYNPGYTRIVFEGPQPVIDRAVVNQKEMSILVTFTGARLSIQAENISIPFKKLGNDRIILSAGEFRGMKVLTLKNPGRLVIDIYQKEQREDKEKNRAELQSPSADSRAATRLRSDAALSAEQKKAPAKRNLILVIDPGHGGFESGTVREGQIEKNAVLDIARKLEALSKKGSFESSLTRSGDLFMSLTERVRNANSRKPDIFLSLHVGNHKDMVIYLPVITDSAPEAIKPYLYSKGQEAYLQKTVALLNSLKDAAAEELGSDMVTVKPLPYSIISGIDAAALMVELPSFEHENYTEEFRMKIANLLNKGLYLYEENEAVR